MSFHTKLQRVQNHCILVLFDEWCDKICDRIKYLISKSGITDSINHNFAIIRMYSYDSLSIEKVLSFQNVIILIKRLGNKNKSKYYCKIFLGKGWYRGKSNTECF